MQVKDAGNRMYQRDEAHTHVMSELGGLVLDFAISVKYEVVDGWANGVGVGKLGLIL